jgi:ligand-binding sensor domain-containing protein
MSLPNIHSFRTGVGILLAALAIGRIGEAASEGQAVSKPLEQYVLDVWTMGDGLPSNTVFDIVQDESGYLWLATDNGITRFDGMRFTTYNTMNTTSLGSNFIRDLDIAGDGSLWIATGGGGLVRYAKGDFARFTKEDGLLNNHITAIAEDDSGALWVGTIEGQLHQFRGGAISVIGLPKNLAPHIISGIDLDESGGVWIAAAQDGLYHYQNGRWDRVSVPVAPPGSRMDSVLIDRAGMVWAGGARLYHLEGGHWTATALPAILGLDTTYGTPVLYEDRSGALWSGGGALHRHANGVLDALAEADGLPDGRVLAILEDREGSIWIGTYSGGLARLKDGRIAHYQGALIPDPGVGITTVHQSVGGNVWVGNESGLVRFDNGRFQIVVPNDGRRLGNVRSIAEYSTGDLWLGSDIGLVR